MWNYNMFPKEYELLQKFSKYSMWAGIFMLIIGMVSLFNPLYGSIFTVSFLAWLMVFGGISIGYFTFKSNRSDYLGWLKSLLLIVVGAYMLFYPVAGIAAVGMLFSIYFFFDGFAGVSLGFAMRPAKLWWLWMLNGIVSFVLSAMFLVNWFNVANEAWLIGIFVGISLTFDGITLLFMGNSIKKV